MKKLRFLTLLVLSYCIANYSYGQSNPVATVQEDKTIDWHLLSPFGQYFLYTNGTLKNIGPETGETVWEQAIPLLYQNSFNRLAGSPFYIVEKDQSFEILDPYTGKIALSLTNLPLQSVDDYRYLSKSNQLVISGINKEQKNHTLLISLDSGETVWNITDSGFLVDAFLLENGDIALSTTEKVYRINSKSGNQIWSTKLLGEEKPNEIAGFKLIGGSRKPNVGEYTLMIHPTKPIAYVGLELQKSQPTPSDANAVSYSSNYYAFDLNKGNHLWKQPLSGGGRLTPLMFLEEGFIAPASSMLGAKINLFQYDNEQAGQWGNKQNGVKIKGNPTDFGIVDAGTIVFTQYHPGSGMLYFINKTTGMPADEEIKVDGNLHSVKGLGNDQVLVLTSEAAYILNIGKGNFEITKSVPTSPALVAENSEKVFIYDTKDNSIKAVTTKTGAFEELSKKTKLLSKADMIELKVTKDGVWVNSLQETLFVGLNGEVKYHKNVEAPKKSAITENLAKSRQVKISYAQVLETGLTGSSNDALTSELREANNQSESIVSEQKKKHLQAIQSRLNMVKNHSSEYAIAGSENIFLVKVDLATGEQLSSTALGSDKKPEYLLDAVSGYLYLMTDDKTVKIFKQ